MMTFDEVRTTVIKSPPRNRRWEPMVDEQALRRSTFTEGVRIRLANGQAWSLPDHRPYKDDPEHLAVLREIIEAEDAADCLRAELALAILLLSRNYDLTPDAFQAVLEFAPGDPALSEMQRSVHELATDQIRALGRFPDSNPGPSLLPKTHWRIVDLLKRQNRVESARSFWSN
jgi:hypothetical protein